MYKKVFHGLFACWEYLQLFFLELQIKDLQCPWMNAESHMFVISEL